MATQPQHPAPPTTRDAPAPDAPAPAPTGSPGGMASDAITALAGEIVTNMKGAPDRFRTQVENNPALKAMMDEASGNMIGEIAQSIRRVVESEIAKVTGGVVPGKAAAAAERERTGRNNPSA
jgi:hypothetical protein